MICQAEVSQSPGSHPNYEYTFYKDYQLVYMEKTNATGILYSIPDSRVVHSGIYECAVDIDKQRRRSAATDLTVKGLLMPVLTVDQLRLTEGDEVTAVCSAEGELGSLMFFFRDGLKELYRESSSSRKVEHKLTLTKSTENLHCYYSISLGSVIEISRNSNVISINIQELDIKPNIKVMPSPQVIEGDHLTISCNVDVSHQRDAKLRINLVHGRTTLSLNMREMDYTMKVKTNDSGEYECISSLSAVHKSSSVGITVKVEVFEGEHFNVSCRSDNFASERIQLEDIKYSIFKDKSQVVSEDVYSATAGKDTNGKYMCMADASGIIKESSNILFRAKVPEITVVGSVILEKPFWIFCESENGSLPITYTLKRNGLTLNRTVVSGPQEEARFLASISTPSDISSFLCEAENNGKPSVKKSQRLHATVIVGKPLLTVIPVPGNIEEGQDVTLICGIPKGSPPVIFKFYGSSRALINSTTVRTNSSSFVLSAVSRENSGNFYCEANNQANILSKSDIIIIEVSLAKWKKALISAFCMLLVALLVLFIVIRYKAKRGKREMAPELSVKPASPNSDDSVILSLTTDTLYSTHTVVVNNKDSVWSQKPPDVSEHDSLRSPNEGDIEYTEVVHPRSVDPTRIPLKKGTDTVYSELQTSPGAPELVSHQGLVEYAELNSDLPAPVD
ncbi:hypothetical protein DNTS_034952 [Danionella cerebrum]|nr:hypothetical protein DNTS_034952 [Danionella translucida]